MMELHNEYMPEILDALCRSCFTREDMHTAMKSGMNGYLSKPLDVDKLYAMMRKCLK